MLREMIVTDFDKNGRKKLFWTPTKEARKHQMRGEICRKSEKIIDGPDGNLIGTTSLSY